MKPFKLGTISALAFAALACTALAQSAGALNNKPVLDLDTAHAMAEACLSHQVAMKHAPIDIVIVDDGGNTILVNRQDGACKACEEIAKNKAKTAALYNTATSFMELRAYGVAKDGVNAEMPGLIGVPGLITFPGGLPIVSKGVPIGGVGVSGATGPEDEQCAQAAIDAVAEKLK